MVTSPDHIAITDIQLWLGQQRAVIDADPRLRDEIRDLRTEALELVGQGVGRLATKGSEEVTAIEVMGEIDSGGDFTNTLQDVPAAQRQAYKTASQRLITALSNPETDFFPAIQAEKERRALEKAEATRQALIAEALQASQHTAEIYLNGKYGPAHFGPQGYGSQGAYDEPWRKFEHSHGTHRPTAITEGVAFTPAWAAKQGVAGRFRRQPVTTYEQAHAANGQPATEIHYMFQPDFNDQTRQAAGWPAQSPMMFRITVSEDLANRIKANGPATIRGIMDALVMHWGRSGRAQEYAKDWTDQPGSARPPYPILEEDWQMTVLDATDKPAQDIIDALRPGGKSLPFGEIYTMDSIAAGPSHAPRLPQAA